MCPTLVTDFHPQNMMQPCHIWAQNLSKPKYTDVDTGLTGLYHFLYQYETKWVLLTGTAAFLCVFWTVQKSQVSRLIGCIKILLRVEGQSSVDQPYISGWPDSTSSVSHTLRLIPQKDSVLLSINTCANQQRSNGSLCVQSSSLILLGWIHIRHEVINHMTTSVMWCTVLKHWSIYCYFLTFFLDYHYNLWRRWVQLVWFSPLSRINGHLYCSGRRHVLVCGRSFHTSSSWCCRTSVVTQFDRSQIYTQHRSHAPPVGGTQSSLCGPVGSSRGRQLHDHQCCVPQRLQDGHTLTHTHSSGSCLQTILLLYWSVRLEILERQQHE